MEIEAQGRKIICRRSHRPGTPTQPPLLLSEDDGALPLCSCLGAAGSGFSLAQVAPRSQPSKAPRALYFDSLTLQVFASPTRRIVLPLRLIINAGYL